MINKYQQGGAAPQQGGGILAQIQQLPQEQQQQIMQAFAQWAQQKGVDIQQLQSNPQALEQALGQFMQEMQQQQAQAAKHGAKLKFIKNLKHQCAEDEKLEYFAKGGAIGCQCVKKNLYGGKPGPEKNALQQYKDKKKNIPVKRTKAEQARIDSLSQEDYEKGYADHTKPGTQRKKIQLKKECGGKMKKHQIGGTIETLRQSLGLEKKNLNKFQIGGNLPPVESKEAAPLMGFFKHMIPGFRQAYKQKQISLTKDPGFIKTPQQPVLKDSGFVKTPIINKPIPQDRGFFKMPPLLAGKPQGGINLGITR